MAVLSLMLVYEELQTPPPARTATVTDDISPGCWEVLRVRGGMEALPRG